MTNPFDRFDDDQEAENPFDQFDQPEPRADAFSQGTSGVNETIASLLGTPVDLAETALNTLFQRPEDTTSTLARINRTANPAARILPATRAVGAALNIPRFEGSFGSGEQLRDVGAETGLIQPEAGPDQPGARLARSIGRNVTEGMAGLLPAGLAGRSAKVAQAAKQGNLTAQLARTIAERPLTTAAAETGAGVLAGVGGELADLTGENPNARALGEIAGGVGGPLGITQAFKLPTRLPFFRSARRVTEGVLGKFVPPLNKAQARAQARKSLSDAIAGDAASEASRVDDVAKNLDLELTLAERTNAPSLIQTQRELEAAATGQSLNDLAARVARNQERVSRFAADVAPKGAPDIEPFERAILKSQKRAEAAVDQLINRQVKRAEGLATRTQVSDLKRAESGKEIRDIIFTAKRAKSAEMSELAETLGLNDTTKVPFNDAGQSLVDEFGDLRLFDRKSSRPEVLRDVEQFLDGGKGDITFEDWQSLSQRITTDAREALGAATPDYKKASTLNRMAERLDELADDAFAQAGDPNLLENYRLFKDRYRREFAEVFRQGPLHDATRKTSRGDFFTSDEIVASRFFSPDAITASRKFKEAVGAEEAARRLEPSIFAKFADDTIKGGVINTDAAERWIRRRKDILKEYPSIDAKLRNVADSAREIRNVESILTARRNLVGDTILARRAKAITKDAKNIDDVINEALRKPKVATALRKAVSDDPAALQSLRRRVWDNLASSKPEDVLGYIAENETSLTSILGRQHVANLKKVSEAREVIGRVGAPRGRSDLVAELRGMQDDFGISTPQLANRILQIKGGFISARFGALDLVNRLMYALNKKEIEAIVKQALYDPDVAKDLRLLWYGNAASQKRARVRLRGYLIQQGERTPDDDAPEENEEGQ